MSSNSSGKNDFINLPQGGGAVAGLGEKFTADLHTGTGNFSVPLTTPAGRNGFHPELQLQYSTGNPNGIFGLGWSMAVPGISRKTSKGIPRYDDCSDVFVLSGMEDLVKLTSKGNKSSYRPRTEASFASIEFIQDSSNSCWLVKNKNGVQSFYGTPGAKGTDPAVVYNPANRLKEFSWLLSETKDSFGNTISYVYHKHASWCGEKHIEETYLARIDYINYKDKGLDKYLVSVHFHYEVRPDQFSTYKSGFEIKTSWRVKEIVVQNNDSGLFCKRYDFQYVQDKLTGVSLLEKIQVVGFDNNNQPVYELAPLEFSYAAFEPQKAKLLPVKGNLPVTSQKDSHLDLLDLDGNGLPDMVEWNGQVRCWKNMGNGAFSDAFIMKEAPLIDIAGKQWAMLDANGDGRADLLSTGIRTGYFSLEFNGQWDHRSFIPYKSFPQVNLADPDTRLIDLDGDGITDIMSTGSKVSYYFNHEEPDKAWIQSKSAGRGEAVCCPDISFSDPRVKTGDMNGNGLHDILFIESGSVSYWPNAGHGNWGHKVIMKNSPSLPLPQEFNRLLLGDINGDGLADMVLVENNQVKIYINQSGYRWSDAIIITGTPSFADGDDVRIIDLNGTGVSGLLWSSHRYYGGPHHYFYLDLSSGNKPYLLSGINNHMGALTRISYTSSSYWYLKDRKENKHWKTSLPVNILTVKSVEVTDKVSKSKLTTAYRYHHGHWDGEEREFRGFGMVEQTDTQVFEDFNKDSTAENVPQKYFSPPVLTKNWFHAGPVRKNDGTWITADFTDEFYQVDKDCMPLKDQWLTVFNALPAEKQKRDALRALRGLPLRSETYTIDHNNASGIPFSVTEFMYGLRHENSGTGEKPVFFPFAFAQRSTRYEGGNDPLTQFSFTDEYDVYGRPHLQTTVSMPRRMSARKNAVGKNYNEKLDEVRILASHIVTGYAAPLNPAIYIHDRVAETKMYSYLDIFGSYLESDSADMKAILQDQYIQARYIHDVVFKNKMKAEIKLEAHQLNYYDGKAFKGLPFAKVGNHGALSFTETLVCTDEQLDKAYTIGLSAAGRRPAYLGGSAAPEPGTPAGFGTNAGYYRKNTPPYENGYYIRSAQNRYDFHAGIPDPLGLLLETRDPQNNSTKLSYDGFYLLPEKITDALLNETNAAYDYRFFAPLCVTDMNGHKTFFAYTASGLPQYIYRESSDGTAGGNAAQPDLSFTYRLIYDERIGQPVSVTTMARTEHAKTGTVNEYIRKTEYSDGFGRLVQTIAQADDVRFGMFGDDAGLSADESVANAAAVGERNLAIKDNNRNTIVSGWQVFDNKGRVVEKYEPFFYTGYDFVADASFGEHATLLYDTLGRQVKVISPDGSMQQHVYGIPVNINQPDLFSPTPWEQYIYDANDLTPLLASNGIITDSSVPASHYFTPASVRMDALGRTIAETRRNGPAPDEWFITRTSYDNRGNVLEITDAKKRLAFAHCYDLINRVLRIDSIDAGNRTKVYNATGQMIEYRDDKGSLMLRQYDGLNRPVRVWAKNDSSFSGLRLTEEIIYGENSPLPGMNGHIYMHYDEAGLVTFHQYDFKNNVLHKTRQVLAAANTGNPVDWATMNDSSLAATGYDCNYSYDALNRITSFTYPADTGGHRSVLTTEYNPSGKLRKVLLDGVACVQHLAYNAKNQRMLIAYGNNTMTRYAYHPQNFRLLRLKTEQYKTGGPPYHFTPDGGRLQDFFYSYDLTGNIRAIRHREPGSGFSAHPEKLDRLFEYDALYRLIYANGREANRSNPVPDFEGLSRQADASQAKGYIERYEYDEMGNLLFLRHHHTNNQQDWVRTFTNETSNNRLQQINLADYAVVYHYDANGNITGEDFSRSMQWDHSDRLVQFTIHNARRTNTSLRATYHYDAAGNRVIKKTTKAGKTVITVYIDGLFEHCINLGNSTANNHLHIMDDQKRIAVIRKGNAMGDTTPAFQYHLGDHLGSSNRVIGGAGATGRQHISIEEYTAYGETSLGSHAKKRYRYSGKERDEESGLYYYGARYYLPWAGRWLSCDPVGSNDATNLFQFLRCNVINHIDEVGLTSKQTQQYVIDKVAEDFRQQVLELMMSNKKGQLSKQQLGTLADDLTTKFYKETGYKGKVDPHFGDDGIATSIDMVIPELELAIELKLSEKAIRERQQAKHLYLAYQKGWSYARVYALGKVENGKFGVKSTFYDKETVKKIIEMAGNPKIFSRPGWDKYGKKISGVLTKIAIPLAVLSVLNASEAYAMGEIDSNQFGEELARQSLPGEIAYQIIQNSPEQMSSIPRAIEDTPTGETFQSPFAGSGSGLDPRYIK